MKILGPTDVPPVRAGAIVQALPIIPLEPDVHQLAPLHADMVLVPPLVHRVLVFVGGGQQAVPVLDPRMRVLKPGEIVLSVYLLMLLGKDCGLPIVVVQVVQRGR